MAFERTKITKEELIEIEKLNIENPVDADYGFGPQCPFELEYRTIDREEDIYLIEVGNEFWEPRTEIYFVFVWKGLVTIPFLRKNWMVGSTILWDIIELKIPEEAEQHREQIIVSLKEALKVYAANGLPEVYSEEKNNRVVVQFKF